METSFSVNVFIVKNRPTKTSRVREMKKIASQMIVVKRKSVDKSTHTQCFTEKKYKNLSISVFKIDFHTSETVLNLFLFNDVAVSIFFHYNTRKLPMKCRSTACL